MLDKKIVATGREFIGTPFIPQGRLKGVGVDCAGLIACIAKQHNLQFEDQNAYNIRQWTGDKLLNEVKLNFEPLQNLENACILLMWFRRPHLPQHFAIYTDRGTIIHTTEDLGRVVEINYDERWIKRTHSIWKFKEIGK